MLFAMNTLQRTKLLWAHISILTIAAAFVWLHAVIPDARNARVHINHRTVSSSLPFRRVELSSDLTLSFELHSGTLSARRYRLFPYGCIDRILVNGKETPSGSCDGWYQGTLDLSHLLSSGRNHVIVRMQNKEPGYYHGFHMRPAPEDPFILFGWGLLFLGIAGMYLCLTLPWQKTSWPMHAVVIGGVFLRVLYTLVTPYSERSYDWTGHLDYIRHLLETASLPSPLMGWESYQPPLYYVLAALWAKLGILSGLTIAEALTTLQVLSLLLSILTFLIAVPIARLVFSKSEAPPPYGGGIPPGTCGDPRGTPHRKHQACASPRSPFLLRLTVEASWCVGERLEQLLFVGLLAVCPGLIFFASRINNDVLVQFFLMFAFWRLLLFWQKSGQKDWLLASAAAGLGILTKMNAVLLLPVLGLVLLLKRFSHRTKLVLAAESAFLFLAIAGWFIVLRFFIEQTNLVANALRLHQITNLEQTWVSFLRFRPWAILQHPVVVTLNSDFPRNAFFEYYFRSILGGISFSGLHVLIVLYLIAFFLLPVVLFGFLKTLRDRNALPILALFVIFIAAHLFFRALYPYASSQDFRYTALVAIPLAYFTVQGTAYAGHLQGFLRGSLLLFIVIAATFPLALAMGF